MNSFNKVSGHRASSVMVTGKAYRSVGIVLIVGAIFYIFMASKMGTGVNVQDVVMFQPIPSEDVTRKNLQNLSQRTTINNVATPQQLLHTSTKKMQNNFDPNNISTDKIPESRSNSSVVMKKIVKIQHSDDGPNFPDEQKINANLNLRNIQKNVTILSDKKIVIIIAYMRTGSTLTASLLQQYPGAFYVFEPIRSLMDAYKKGNRTQATLNYIHGKVRQYSAEEQNRVVIDEINNWLTCRIDSISIQSLTDEFHKHYTKYMRNFYYCVKERMLKYSKPYQNRIVNRIQMQLRKYYDNAKDIDTCLKTAIDNCRKAPLLVLKFIRLKMEEIYPILPMYPNMKIIHLVRDPRGILNSRIRVSATTRKNYREYVQRQCSAFSDNLNISKRIQEEYPDRIKTVHYEDMAEHPLETARSLVEFAGIQFVKPMQDFIRKQTSSTRDSCAYCTQRKNSTITANRWRTQLNPIYATYIDSVCKSSNSILGYLPLTNVSMKDMKIPSRKHVNVTEELLHKFVT